MADTGPRKEALNLKQNFPATTTAEWEEAIQADLKDQDYAKRLIWRTDEGLAVRPYYRREDLAGLEAQTDTVPGQYPFVRGQLTPWEPRQDWQPHENAIRADFFHEAGGHAVQELGYAIAEGVERLAKLVEEGESVDDAARSLEFVFSIGSNYFFEIAKLRAARLLWAQAVSAFGPSDESSCFMRIHARTARANKSIYDPCTNLLRATTEALSAVIGGCQTLSVEPFGFDPEVALNVQRILAEEVHLDCVADPAGGSYYIEALTDALAREAWKLFQQVEAQGGHSAALASGTIAQALEQSRREKEKAVSTRRRILVGVNSYPNLKEKSAGTNPPAPDPASPFAPYRLAEAFERIRQRTERHTRNTGRCPKVLLLRRGDPKVSTARANFCLNLFGCAGFDVVETDGLEDLQADLVVLCSSDSEYAAFAREVAPKVQAPMIVAGNPKEQAEELKAVGVQGFVYQGIDAVEVLFAWQDRLGMEE